MVLEKDAIVLVVTFRETLAHFGLLALNDERDLRTIIDQNGVGSLVSIVAREGGQ